MSGDPGPSTLRSVENRQTSEENLHADEIEQLEMQRILLAEANARLQETRPTQAVQNSNQSMGPPALQAANRSASDGNLDIGANRYMRHEKKSTASLAPTLAAATGELNLGDNGLDQPPKTTAGNKDKGKGKDREQYERAEMFAKRPVQPIPGAGQGAVDTPSSLARSKSQLTLLLEKDRARTGEQKPKDERKRGKKG